MKRPVCLSQAMCCGVKRSVSEIVEHRLETRGQQEIAPGREAPDEKLEDGFGLLAAIQIGLDHVELVEIGGKRTGQRFVHQVFHWQGRTCES